jgi:hypothetical protein
MGILSSKRKFGFALLATSQSNKVSIVRLQPIDKFAKRSTE